MPMAVLMKNKMERQEKEEVLCEIYGNSIWGGGVNITVNIWCMLDLILIENCRNTLSLHN